MKLRNGFAAQPTYTLEINDDRGKLAEIPFAVEPIASDKKRAKRAGAIAILIALLLQQQTDENFANLAAAVGHESADAVRRLAVKAKVDRFNCRLLDDRGRHIQCLRSHKPDYAVKTGESVSISAIAQLAREGGES